jgi:prepilin-type N-terminal cleavage/methylation domain-containing protein
MINSKGYTLVEIIITMGVSAIIVAAMTFGLFNFRNSVQYDILLNQIVESVNYSKTKASASQLDSEGASSAYGVKFFENEFVEFEGTDYVEGDAKNVENSVPAGLRLSTTCATENGQVVFSKVLGENSNDCIVEIYKWEQTSPTGSIVVGKYGVEQAN